MNWHAEVAAEFSRRKKVADAGVIEELAQHAAAAFEAARRRPVGCERRNFGARARLVLVRADLRPRRLDATTRLEAAPAGRSWFAGLGLDIRLAFRMLRRQPGFAFVSIAMIALAALGGWVTTSPWS